MLDSWEEGATLTQGQGQAASQSVRKPHTAISDSDVTPDKLHKTTYIWAYDLKNDLGNTDMITLKQKYDDGLIEMTEKRLVQWNSFYVSTGNVKVGLMPYGADFIRRLDDRARRDHTNVNIVNMDAIGDNRDTRINFINPLMKLNERQVW